jgi:hypothetical protein
MGEMLTTEIDNLVTIAERLSRDAARSDSALGPERVEDLGGVIARGGQLITRLYGKDSHYHRTFQNLLSKTNITFMHSGNFRPVSELTGILKGVQHDIKSGLLNDFRRLLQAEIFADFLDMAEHLLNEGYKDAAAVLFGAVLEDSLRKIADANAIPTTAENGKSLTIDPLNVAIAKTGVYGPLVQKQVTTWANLRNDAAHGHFSKYDLENVKQMLHFVQKFCADYLK